MGGGAGLNLVFVWALKGRRAGLSLVLVWTVEGWPNPCLHLVCVAQVLFLLEFGGSEKRLKTPSDLG